MNHKNFSLKETSEEVTQSFSHIGQVYYSQGKLYESTEALRYALSASPKSAIAHYNLATVLDEAGRLEEAVDCFSQAIDLDPTMAMAYNNLGVALSKQGKRKLARKAFRQVTKLMPICKDAYYPISAAFYNLGQDKKALNSFCQALEKDPHSVRFHEGLQIALSRVQAIGEAFSKYQTKQKRIQSKQIRREKIKLSLLSLDPLPVMRSLFCGGSRNPYPQVKPPQVFVGASVFAAVTLSPLLAMIPQSGMIRHMSVLGSTGLPTGSTSPRLLPLSPQEPIQPNLSQNTYAASTVNPSAAYQGSLESLERERNRKTATTSVAPDRVASPSSDYLIDDALLEKSDSSSAHNIRLGPVGLDLQVSSQLEFNDNISSSGVKSRDDVIARVGVNLSSTWEITRFNKLSLNLGTSYEKYFSNSELDSTNNFLNLTDDSGLSFEAQISDVTLKVYDNFAFSVDPSDTRVPDGNGGFNFDIVKFGRFTNVVGAEARWEGKHFATYVGAEREDILPQDSEFDFTRSVQYNVPAGVEYALAKNKTVGLNFSYFTRSYEEDTNGFRNNDGDGYSLLPWVAWEPAETLRLFFSTGFKEIDSDNNGTNGDSSDSSAWVYQGRIEHILSKQYSHYLGFSRDSRFGLSTNSQEVDSLTYGFNWKALRNTDFAGNFTYEHVNDSGPTGEEFDRFIASIGTGYQINKKMSLDLSYRYTSKSSDDSLRSFDQNQVVFGFNYDF